jgi:hypothetical protein
MRFILEGISRKNAKTQNEKDLSRHFEHSVPVAKSKQRSVAATG